MERSDADLVAAVRTGRGEAYGELVRRYVAAISAVCRSKLGHRGPVEDMTQEAFMRGYRAIETLKEPERVGSWLYGIASRACLDWLKAKERSQVSLGETEASVPDTRTAGDPEDERREKILSEVCALPEIYRETVMCFYYKKQNYREMSELLGITPAAINARLSKARSLLRDRLASARES